MTTALALVGWLAGVLGLAVAILAEAGHDRHDNDAAAVLVGAALAVTVVGSVAGGALFL